MSGGSEKIQTNVMFLLLGGLCQSADTCALRARAWFRLEKNFESEMRDSFWLEGSSICSNVFAVNVELRVSSLTSNLVFVDDSKNICFTLSAFPQLQTDLIRLWCC